MGNISIRGAANYVVRIDGDYNNQVANPYTANAGATPICNIGVIAWSLGADQEWATGCNGDKNAGICVRRRDFVAVICAGSAML